MPQRYIVVEGLIGVGKTSLCRLLAQEWGGRLVLEPSDTNPFLEPFYREPARFSFPVQMFYLMTRWKQQDAIRQGDLFAELVVSDYLFEKDRLFAEKTLPEMEFELYERFANALGEQTPRPDLVVFLDAPMDVVMKRIAKRAMPGEELIKRDYLVDLRERYQRLLAEWTRCPVLYLDNSELNYVDDAEGKRRVLSLVEDGLSGRPVPRFPRERSPGAVVDREDQPGLFNR